MLCHWLAASPLAAALPVDGSHSAFVRAHDTERVWVQRDAASRIEAQVLP